MAYLKWIPMQLYYHFENLHSSCLLYIITHTDKLKISIVLKKEWDYLSTQLGLEDEA